jgi:hypothetical protein
MCVSGGPTLSADQSRSRAYTRPGVFSETLYLQVFPAGASTWKSRLSAPWARGDRDTTELLGVEGGNSPPLLPTQPARPGPMQARRTWYHHETNLLLCCVVYTQIIIITIIYTRPLLHPHPSLLTSARDLHRLHRDSTPHHSRLMRIAQQHHFGRIGRPWPSSSPPRQRSPATSRSTIPPTRCWPTRLC